MSKLNPVAQAITQISQDPRESSHLYGRELGEALVIPDNDEALAQAIYSRISIPTLTLRVPLSVPGHIAFLEFKTDYNESGLTAYMDVRVDGETWTDMQYETDDEPDESNWDSYAHELWQVIVQMGGRHSNWPWLGDDLCTELRGRIDWMLAHRAVHPQPFEVDHDEGSEWVYLRNRKWWVTLVPVAMHHCAQVYDAGGDEELIDAMNLSPFVRDAVLALVEHNTPLPTEVHEALTAEIESWLADGEAA